MQVILFTTGCPNCEKLEALLKQKRIDFVAEENVQEVIDMGFTQAPILKVISDDGEINYYNFVPAMKMIRAGGL